MWLQTFNHIGSWIITRFPWTIKLGCCWNNMQHHLHWERLKDIYLHQMELINIENLNYTHFASRNCSLPFRFKVLWKYSTLSGDRGYSPAFPTPLITFIFIELLLWNNGTPTLVLNRIPCSEDLITWDSCEPGNSHSSIPIHQFMQMQGEESPVQVIRSLP